ncbi:hypothetical protein [Winogradskyella sp. PG-2]|uniref:hypothetical protein n=1 Tax=Winogradskyella sp. PG-2 TaxID=754409 RepID=UPI00045878BF|nr:hypothetical protein [Winogradskyella sp. PG-2]BAO77140.1 hypothetical protein WPG_2910 [Winogradskyella sp. PG-2]
MKKHFFLSVLLGFLIISCSKDDDTSPNNPLVDIEILGEWDISARGVNNISSLEVICCHTLSFYEDADNRDFKGTYVSNDSGFITSGSFIIDNNIISYTTDLDNTYMLEFSIENNVLEVWSIDEDNGDRNWSQYLRVIE